MLQNLRGLTLRRIFGFWSPLAATWLMMAVEGPFLAAVIARLVEPKYNLAAYGVAFSFALIIEAPIIMIMSAATALVKDRNAFLKLRRFTYTLNALITAVMLLFILKPVFYFVAQRMIGLPENVAWLTRGACIILLPWPSAIGVRRFYQGVLIRYNRTRLVAYGTIIRLVSMATTALICAFVLRIEGAFAGAIALSTGVVFEAFATRLMAQKITKKIVYSESSPDSKNTLSYRYIARFYWPLALTSILALCVHPMVTFFMGRSRFAIESLAVIPVINALLFIFRCMGLSFQEVGIALIGEKYEGYRVIRKFAFILGMITVCILSAIAFTPLSTFWFRHVSGLSMELSQFAYLPLRIAVIIPGLAVLLSFQRSIMVKAGRTGAITIATAIEVLVMFLVLTVAIDLFNAVGVVAAACAYVIGRVCANLYLFFPYFRVLGKIRHVRVPDN